MGEPGSITSKRTSIPVAMMSGPPMSPSIAMRRGTRPERYISQPSSSPFPKPTMKPGPSRNVQSWIPTSALPKRGSWCL